MSENDPNPFATARVTTTTSAPSDSALYSATVYLAQTRPWLLFMGVIGLLLSAMMGLVGVATLAILGGDPTLGLFGPFLGAIYLVGGALYALPSLLMLQQALAIGAVTSGGGFDAVTEVLRHNRNFWRLIGGFTLLSLVLYCGGVGLVATIAGVGTNLESTFDEVASHLDQ